jgi:eukaryotic-like serine/threonine-protein kinase
MRHDERAQLVAELFKSVVEIDPQDRDAFLDKHCQSNADLRREIEALLETHGRAEKFMEKSAVHVAAERFVSRGAFAPGQMVGGYEIISLIGKGGMGEVYLARDRQLDRLVALKLVRRGMDNEHIVRRFKHEQRLLAALNHPNIAQLYEADVTTDGIPFFAMEHVDGTRIDDYCREANLSIQQRLELFCKVCAGVHYAHQHLVVHRDIKPSNILVTAYGQPKLLDFGIAKLLESEGDTGEQTITVGAVMTPEYASPEHVRGESITTASDVYSLGVLLYELLTEQKPYKIDSRIPIEIARVVTEKEPTKPSAAVANHDGSSKFEIRNSKFLKGDLDNIVLMSMRKEPQRRYSSVAQFAGDIRRHLDDLPVRARKDTFAYRTSKFAQRHRLGVVAALLLILSLVTGVIATVVQSHKAQQAKAKAEAINDFLAEMLNYTNPNTTAKKSADQPITIKDVLDKAANQLDRQDFSHEPEVNAELNSILGESYASQGFYDVAEKRYRLALEYDQQVAGGNYLSALETKVSLADTVSSQGRNEEAEKLCRHILPALRLESQKGTIEPGYLATALLNFAVLRRARGSSHEAEELLRESLPLVTDQSEKSKNLLNLIRNTLILTLVDQGKLDEAIQHQREDVERFRRNSSANTADFGYALTGLGSFLSEKGDFAEADSNLIEAEKIYRRLLGDQHLWLGDNLRLQANSLYKQRRFDEAQRKIQETLSIYKAAAGPQYINFATALMIQGLILNQTGKVQEAEQALREAVKIRDANLPRDHFLSALARGALGECLTSQKRFAEAEPLLLESYHTLKKSQGAANPRTRIARQRLVTLYEACGNADKAELYRSQLTSH